MLQLKLTLKTDIQENLKSEQMCKILRILVFGNFSTYLADILLKVLNQSKELQLFFNILEENILN